MRKRFSVLLAAAVMAGLLVWQRQSIDDFLAIYAYTPPTSVSDLADQMTATSSARRLFYINHPAIEDRDAFNSSCSNKGEHTIVLGCYHAVNRGIFIFHVSDDRLNGVDQVTAAHEMLHAAYDRLGRADRARIDAELQDFYDHGLYDERIKTIMAAYQKTEPNDLKNEMHSIFGTEIAVLPPDLETYYKQYFTDRGKVVAYASSYQAEFTSRQAKVADFDARLAALKQQINSNTASLDQRESSISALRSQMDAQRSSGDISSYNQNVPLYNNAIDSYNALITATKGLISQYNQMVSDRNRLALQVTELAHSIDSSFQPISN
jgi:hypothetical protein